MSGDDKLVEGVILAGGKASRMKENKMMLLYNDKPLIYHTVKSMFKHCNKITIVTGYYNIDYYDVLKEFNNISVINNEMHELGMFGSVKKAVEEVQNDFFLIPGDYPLVKEETYKKLLDGDGPIRVPIFNGRRGHPIFISRNLIEDLLSEGTNSNLKVWRDKHCVNYIDVDDPGTIMDIDTVSDYIKLKERIEKHED